MLAFIKADLAAVNRTATPWVVAFSHKLWFMDSTDFSELSVLLQQGGVDVLFAGHSHIYLRLLPYYPVTKQVGRASADNHTYVDPEFTVMILSGAPGDIERNDECPSSGAVHAIAPACSSGYGYGVFTPFNATHLYWSFTAKETPIGADGARVSKGAPAAAAPVTYEDYLWIVRSAPPAAGPV
jgi:hypothetical protein